MTCQVIINDFEIAERALYILDDLDFAAQERCWNDIDNLLIALQHNEMFKGRRRWMDLEIRHFHVMIVNMLKMLSGMAEEIRADKASEPVARLTFFLCGIISLIQQSTGSSIDLFRITRVSTDDVLYDYCATLDVKIDTDPPRGNLKIVIDNGR